MTLWIARLVFAISCGLSTTIASADSKLSFQFGGARTVAGDLTIKKFKRMDDEIVLNGEVVLRGDLNHVSWFVEGAYPQEGKASLVLLGFDMGFNNPTQYMYRVLELQSDGRYRLSPEFGNRQEFLDWNLSDEEILKRKSSRFIDGEWRLGFPQPNGGKKLIWYVYKDGEVYLDGKKIENINPPH